MNILNFDIFDFFVLTIYIAVIIYISFLDTCLFDNLTEFSFTQTSI